MQLWVLAGGEQFNANLHGIKGFGTHFGVFWETAIAQIHVKLADDTVLRCAGHGVQTSVSCICSYWELARAGFAAAGTKCGVPALAGYKLEPY